MILPREAIPHIINKTNHRLELLRLKPETPLTKEHLAIANRYYITACVDQSKKIYIFKSSLKNDIHAIHGLRCEIYFHQSIYKNKSISYVPSYIASGNTGRFVWMLRERAGGQEAGNLREINSFVFSKNHIPQFLKKLFVLRKELKKAFLSKHCPLTLPRITYAYEFYLEKKNKLDYKPILFRRIKEYQKHPIDFKWIINFYREHRTLLARSLEIPVHGDLNPRNILIQKNSLHIFDWERVHLDNLPGEIDFLWASMWNNPVLQKKLFTTYFERIKDKKEFITLWRLVIIARCWGEAWCWYREMEKSKDKRFIQKCEKAIRFHLDCLSKTTRGFDHFFY